MPSTTRKKTVESKPAAKVAKAAPKAAKPAAKAAVEKIAPKTPKAAPVKAAAKAPAAMPAEKAPVEKVPAEKAPAEKAAKKAAPARKAKPQPAILWTPREIPLREIEGRVADPRLAAALAARERWHGRSGRPALKSATQAVAFVRERHLVHPTVQSALPNLIDPIVGKSCSTEDRTVGQPAQTLRGWREDLDGANDLLEVRLCFEQPTIVQADLWPCLLAVAAPREEAAHAGGFLSEGAEEALQILERKGVVAADRLRQLVGLEPKQFERVHAELEARLLVLSRGDFDEDDRPETVLEPLARWAGKAGVRRDVELARAWTFLFIAAVRASVVLWPEEAEALFPWSAEERRAAIAEALGTGAVVTYSEKGEQAFVASPVPR